MTSRPAWLERFPSAEVRALDPARHTLIEASAGTGKTFAVEHLVLRLLMENPDWMPEEILLLSFTEKTAADLRARIRALLHRQVRPGAEGSDKPPIPGWSEEDLRRLRLLWTHADDLAVHTLHAFCQSSLRRDPLASDVLLRDEVAEDLALADDALENLLRGAWAKDPARLERLREALKLGDGDGWRGKLIRPMLAWHPWRGDRLDPEPSEERAPLLDAEIRDACSCLRDALARVNAGSIALGDYLSRLRGKNPESNAFVRAGRLLDAFVEEKPLLAAMVTTFYGTYEYGTEKRGKTRAFKQGFVALLETTRGRDIASLAEWAGFASACDAALRLGLRIEEERARDALRLRARAIAELREELAREKRRRGCISYDDMPANLLRALRGDAALAERIRRRYKACIVDEFQDTDPVQWEILERLCLCDAEAATRPALPLFLVGDPKQAIYGFRGGDLRTYLAARARFRELAARGRAQGFGLEANFRSRRALIEALNAAFARAEWFGPAPREDADPAWKLPPGSGDVAFTPARAGNEDAENVPRLILRDFRVEGAEPPKKADVEREMRRWIAARIVAGLDAGRPPSDFAVLVRKNAEGEAIERLLRRRGVPCRVKRRGGLFHGPSADALRLLLEWIEDAGDPDVQARILLLPFARRDAADLPQGRPARTPPLLAEWAALARAGRWPAFFDAVRRQGGYRDRLAEQSPSEAERFDRLVRILAEAGAAPQVSARALRERFDALRRGEGEDDAEGADPSEGAGGVVSIMTLHMSKGLEFPVVFVAAAGEGVKSDHFVLRPPGEKGFRIVLDTKDPAALREHASQEHGEDKRLFYVAFTRARDELHVPLLPPAFKPQRSAGPLGGFAADALRAAAADPATESLFRRDEAPVSDAARVPDAVAADAKPGDAPTREQLLEEARAAFARRRALASYSALARQAEGRTAHASSPLSSPATSRTPGQAHAPAMGDEASEIPAVLEESGARVRRDESAPDASSDLPAREDAPRPGITAEELPPGAASGTALHALLEETVFASAAESEGPEAWLRAPGRLEQVEEALKRESVDAACAAAAARAAWNTLRMPLPDPAGGPDFRLSELSNISDYRHEVEFLIPFDVPEENPVLPERLPEGVSRRGNFLWGFIDLVFRREGRYYLLDWKSNLLPAYDAASIRKSMEAHAYDLQWKLYSVVLDRWLRRHLPGYDPAVHFGGVHYLYLRGAAPDRFSGFATRPAPSQLRVDFPAEIARLLGGAWGSPGETEREGG